MDLFGNSNPFRAKLILKNRHLNKRSNAVSKYQRQTTDGYTQTSLDKKKKTIDGFTQTKSKKNQKAGIDGFTQTKEVKGREGIDGFTQTKNIILKDSSTNPEKIKMVNQGTNINVDNFSFSSFDSEDIRNQIVDDGSDYITRVIAKLMKSYGMEANTLASIIRSYDDVEKRKIKPNHRHCEFCQRNFKSRRDLLLFKSYLEFVEYVIYMDKFDENGICKVVKTEFKKNGIAFFCFFLKNLTALTGMHKSFMKKQDKMFIKQVLNAAVCKLCFLKILNKPNAYDVCLRNFRKIAENQKDIQYEGSNDDDEGEEEEDEEEEEEEKEDEMNNEYQTEENRNEEMQYEDNNYVNNYGCQTEGIQYEDPMILKENLLKEEVKNPEIKPKETEIKIQQEPTENKKILTNFPLGNTKLSIVNKKEEKAQIFEITTDNKELKLKEENIFDSDNFFEEENFQKEENQSIQLMTEKIKKNLKSLKNYYQNATIPNKPSFDLDISEILHLFRILKNMVQRLDFIKTSKIDVSAQSIATVKLNAFKLISELRTKKEKFMTLLKELIVLLYSTLDVFELQKANLLLEEKEINDDEALEETQDQLKNLLDLETKVNEIFQDVDKFHEYFLKYHKNN
ncbi:MAG: hypothetical protein MJ252_02125 [archaeon]|nr:hypothetical protein [archaeon]